MVYVAFQSLLTQIWQFRIQHSTTGKSPDLPVYLSYRVTAATLLARREHPKQQGTVPLNVLDKLVSNW
jgi:hypothetical protein